jgi:hypothetical protein
MIVKETYNLDSIAIKSYLTILKAGKTAGTNAHFISTIYDIDGKTSVRVEAWVQENVLTTKRCS